MPYGKLSKTLENLHTEINFEARKGFPLLLFGAVIFLLFVFMPSVFPMETVHLIWIFGLGAIFPFGILLIKILGVNIFAPGNPLGTLGGLLGAP